MKWCLIFLLLIGLSAANSCTAEESRLPNRRDCIVRIDMHWKEITGMNDDRERVIGDLNRAISMAAASGGPNYDVSQSIPPERNVVFLQFKDDCADRAKMADELSSYVMEAVANSPPLIVSREVIDPGVDTIDVWGPSWADPPD